MKGVYIYISYVIWCSKMIEVLDFKVVNDFFQLIEGGSSWPFYFIFSFVCVFPFSRLRCVQLYNTVHFRQFSRIRLPLYTLRYRSI
jgi:hypothetical protein